MLSQLFCGGTSLFRQEKCEDVASLVLPGSAQPWCTNAAHEGSATLPEALPHASPDQLPPRLAPGTTVPPLVRTGAFEWDWPNYLHSAQRGGIVSCEAWKPGGPSCQPVGL